VRVVLDTNIIISALVFYVGQFGWLREAWINQQFIPVVNKTCAEELLPALTYPKFKLSDEEIRSLLGVYLPYTITIESTTKPRKKSHVAKIRTIRNSWNWSIPVTQRH
jgi:uncharacterized protein